MDTHTFKRSPNSLRLASSSSASSHLPSSSPSSLPPPLPPPLCTLCGPPPLRLRQLLPHLTPTCNLLISGITHESLLYTSLNHTSLTVFLDESEPLANCLERESPTGTRLEAYDVTNTTKVSHLRRLLHTTRDEIASECRSVQNLFFSDCPVALNELPNHVYDVPWEATLIDGLRGYDEDSPGRMAAVFTVAVLARSKARGKEREGVVTATEVMVHECDGEAEMVSSEEFLCEENLIEKVSSMARFVVPLAEVGSAAFCRPRANETASFEEDE